MSERINDQADAQTFFLLANICRDVDDTHSSLVERLRKLDQVTYNPQNICGLIRRKKLGLREWLLHPVDAFRLAKLKQMVSQAAGQTDQNLDSHLAGQVLSRIDFCVSLPPSLYLRVKDAVAKEKIASWKVWFMLRSPAVCLPRVEKSRNQNTNAASAWQCLGCEQTFDWHGIKVLALSPWLHVYFCLAAAFGVWNTVRCLSMFPGYYANGTTAQVVGLLGLVTLSLLYALVSIAFGSGSHLVAKRLSKLLNSQ